MAGAVVNQPGNRMPDLGISTCRPPGQVDVDTCGRADRVAVLVEAAQRQMAVVEIDSDNCAISEHLGLRSLGVDREALCWGGPGCAQITSGPAWFARDRVGDRLSARDPGLPLLAAIPEH